MAEEEEAPDAGARAVEDLVRSVWERFAQGFDDVENGLKRQYRENGVEPPADYMNALNNLYINLKKECETCLAHFERHALETLLSQPSARSAPSMAEEVPLPGRGDEEEEEKLDRQLAERREELLSARCRLARAKAAKRWLERELELWEGQAGALEGTLPEDGSSSGRVQAVQDALATARRVEHLIERARGVEQRISS